MGTQKATSILPRIAVVGSGPSGLALAGILSKRLGDRIHIDIFERGSRDQDQGYGLDLDESGQKALAMAGVYDRYWEISRPRSDVMQFYLSRGESPLFILNRPKLLQRLFPSKFAAQPESNRDGIRQILLDKMTKKGNADIRYSCCPSEIRKVCDGLEGNKVELLDDAGESLGVYDFVVDASGVHSRLRLNRVVDERGKHYTGRMMIHGVINDPDMTASSALLERLGQGSLVVMSRQGMLVIQRFGAHPDDHRTSFFYFTERDDEHSLDAEIGLHKANSRQQGIRTDVDSLAKVKAWIHKDMGETYEPLYHTAVDLLDRVTVRGEYSHGDTSLREPSSMPFAVIGDALRNIGIGGGGNLALQDSIELAECLCNEKVCHFGEDRVDMNAIYEVEKTMLERKNEFHNKRKEERAKEKSSDVKNASPLTLKDLVGGNRFLAALIKTISSIFITAFRWEQWRGISGSGPESRIFPSVEASLRDSN